MHRHFAATLTAVLATAAFAHVATAAEPNTIAAVPQATAAKATAPNCKNCFAVVRRNGTLARGNGVKSVLRLSNGQYEVLFKANVTKCAFIAAIGTTAFSGIETAGFITVAGAAGTTNGVFVATTNTSLAPEDRAFHLDVKCP